MPGKLDRAVVRRRRHRQHDEVGIDPQLLVSERVLDEDLKSVVLRMVVNLGRSAAHIDGAVFGFGTFDELVETLAEGTQIGVEDGDLLDARIVLAHEHRILDCVHAAESAAIRATPFAARADALDEDDSFWSLHIGGPHDMALGDAGGVEHAFEFEAGDNIGKPAVAVVAEFASVEFLETHRHQNRTGRDLDVLSPHVELDGMGHTSLLFHPRSLQAVIGALSNINA